MTQIEWIRRNLFRRPPNGNRSSSSFLLLKEKDVDVYWVTSFFRLRGAKDEKQNSGCLDGNFLITDIRENALRKFIGQALRNEIDVSKVWICFEPVSHPELYHIQPL